MGKITVGIMDDNEKISMLLEDILRPESDIEVVGTALDGVAGLELIREKEPDVVLLDLVMSKVDGLGVLERLYTEKWKKDRLLSCCLRSDRRGSRSRHLNWGPAITL